MADQTLSRWFSKLSFKSCHRTILNRIKSIKEGIQKGTLSPSEDISSWIKDFNRTGDFIHLYHLLSTFSALHQLQRLSFCNYFEASNISFKLIKFLQLGNWNSMVRHRKLAYLSAILFLEQNIIYPRRCCRKILRWYRYQKIVRRCRFRNLIRNLLPLNEDLIWKINSYL